MYSYSWSIDCKAIRFILYETRAYQFQKMKNIAYQIICLFLYFAQAILISSFDAR